jgi:hypothetical protein
MTKVALLMGLNYRGSEAALNGCINDVENTGKVLENVYGYKSENITYMTDDSEIKPTAKNIVDQLIKISERTNKENIQEVWISYSGHGSYIEDKNGDEDDSKDECLVPLDYRKSGMISDDFLNHVFSLINKNTRVIAIIDACHSETMLDLPYRYISGNKNVIENSKSNVNCNCIMISGCRDNQTSSDAYNINNSKEYSGAMTSALLFVLENFEYTITCWRLLKEMRRFLKNRKFSQVPQISCTNKLNCAKLFSCVSPKSFIRN